MAMNEPMNVVENAAEVLSLRHAKVIDGDKWSFVQDLSLEGYKQFREVIKEVLATKDKRTADMVREIREALTREHYGFSYETDKCVECCNNIRIDESIALLAKYGVTLDTNN